MDDPSTDYDVAIIGGGPAGSAMGCYLAKAGVKCVVFERAVFPREHVGESLVPSSTRVFKDLDFLPVMEAAGFPHKYGAVWTAATSKSFGVHDWEGLDEDCAVDHASIRFEERAQPGVDSTYTYHVDRGKFDQLLLQHAEKFGATVHQGVKVQGVDFDKGKRPIVTVEIGGEAREFRVKMVVDASGRNTVLGNQLKLKIKDTVFDQYAFHTWFDGYQRDAVGRSDQLGDYIFVHFLPISNSWVWQIPITDTITSIGVVTQKKNFPKARESREAFFWECVASRPELHDALRKAKQVRPFKEEGDYSYSMQQICGDRWVMIGDAARFVDPIFSTGVSIALNSARFASRDVIAALEADDYGRERFETYESTIRRGTKNWYDFISVYYRLNILFTFFINSKSHRLEVLKLLQGDVYDVEPPAVLDKMRAAVQAVENDVNHPWHGLLNDMTAGAFAPLF
ncbi:MAG: NAD(P)/FAD-dependent oxidoreductase [Byssovorax sp.]